MIPTPIKVRIISHTVHATVEKDFNQWVETNSNKIEIIQINFSEGSYPSIAIFYREKS